jgi:hypothetical protein
MKRDDPHNGEALHAEENAEYPTELIIFVPESTIRSIKQCQLAAQKKAGIADMLETSEQTKRSLTADKDPAWLEDTARFRDKNNNGMT